LVAGPLRILDPGERGILLRGQQPEQTRAEMHTGPDAHRKRKGWAKFERR
jgi:hypothetical protein